MGPIPGQVPVFTGGTEAQNDAKALAQLQPQFNGVAQQYINVVGSDFLLKEVDSSGTIKVLSTTNRGGATEPTNPFLYQTFFKIPDGANPDGALYTWNGTAWV